MARKPVAQILAIYAVLGIALATSACGGAPGGASDGAGSELSQAATQNVAALFSASQLIVQVAYEPGAEPFVNNMPSGRPLWAITQDNLAALFSRRAHVPALQVPTDLTQMTAMAAQGRGDWTISDVLNLAAVHQAGASTAQAGRFFVAFVRGFYAEGGSRQSNVLGIQVTGTTTIAIFKDAIRAASGNPSGTIARYMEQATVIHELGHAIGLVNNGVPARSGHHDSAHGSHCANDNCVMNWENSGSVDFAAYIEGAIATGSTVMFDDHCLDDVAAY